MKKTVTYLILIFLVFSVNSNKVEAYSWVEFQTKLSNMLAQVFTLKAKLDNLLSFKKTNENERNLRSFPPDLSCLILTRNLSYGDRGQDVSKLQMFLARDSYIYPEGAITGVFDLATQRAVKRYQVANGIISWGSPNTTGFGVVGPRTRETMALGCENLNATSTATTSTSTATSTNNQITDTLVSDIKTYQAFGEAPFKVLLTFKLNNACTSYSIDWGDKSQVFEKFYDPNNCEDEENEGRIVRINHIYPRNGVYTIVLRAGEASTPNNLGLQLPTVAYTTVVVGDAIMPFSIDVTEGPAPLEVNAKFTLTHPSCTSYQVDWGDGDTTEFEVNTYTCQRNPKTFNLRHIYNSVGTYEVTFRAGPDKIINLPIRERWLIDVTNLQPGATIVNVDNDTGPAPLTVEVQLVGTWGYCTSYEIDWGDGSGIQRKEFVAQENSEFSVDDFIADQDQEADPYADCSGAFERTFTHTYVTPAAYQMKIKFGRGPLQEITPVTHWVSVTRGRY